METWQYETGHVWRYDGEEVPAGMHLRFDINEEAQAAGLCGCACGVCGPDDPHTVEQGCACDPLGCPCFERTAG